MEGMPGEEQKKELVEFDGTPREELEAMAKNLMSEEEQENLPDGEVKRILMIARMDIAKKEVPPSVHDAIVNAAIIRLGVREFSRSFAVGPDGLIIASGSTGAEAMKNAQKEKAE